MTQPALFLPLSLFSHRWMNLKQLKNWARPCILLPPLSAFIGKSKNCQFDIYSWSAFGWKKKNPTLSLSLFYSLCVSLNPLMVTPMDFGNLRPGVKMAASGESAHPSWLPQLCWLLDHAKQAKCRRYEDRTASRVAGVRALVQCHCKTKGSGSCRNTASQKIN